MIREKGAGMLTHHIHLIVNETRYEVEVESNEFLSDVLRDKLHLTGTKESCGMGDCGTCTVIMEGVTVTSCLTLAVEADGKEIVTIEGVAPGNGELHPIQKKFSETGAIQCGFCTPGMIMSAKALLDRNPAPSEEDIKDAIGGNLCRCTGYIKIIEAIAGAANDLTQREGSQR
jgi:carbon-monoxide dehydrogenase small subunit